MNDQNPHDGVEPERGPGESATVSGVPSDGSDARSPRATDHADSGSTEQTASDHSANAAPDPGGRPDSHAGVSGAQPTTARSSDGVVGGGADTETATSQVSGTPDRPAAGRAPSYGVGPFSVREVAVLGVWVVAFFVSFFRTNILDSPSGVLVGGGNVWLSGLWWIPAVALPTVAVGLLVLRRLSPQGIRRVGSLGIDQFASVAFTVSALIWISWVWDTVAVFDETGIWTRSWVIWVEAVVLLAGVVLTVFAPLIPPFSADFRDREEIPAHRNARPLRPVMPRPRAPRAPRESPAPTGDTVDAPAPGSYTGSTDLAHDGTAHGSTRDGGARPHAPAVDGAHTGEGGASREQAAPPTTVLPAHHGDEHDTDIFAPLRDTGAHERIVAEDRTDPDGRTPDVSGSSGQDDRDHAHAQAFWALAPEERDVVDDYGTPIFRIGPTAWALVIEDRGETFVVRHDDGRIGYLHDVSGVTRG